MRGKRRAEKNPKMNNILKEGRTQTMSDEKQCPEQSRGTGWPVGMARSRRSMGSARVGRGCWRLRAEDKQAS